MNPCYSLIFVFCNEILLAYFLLFCSNEVNVIQILFSFSVVWYGHILDLLSVYGTTSIREKFATDTSRNAKAQKTNQRHCASIDCLVGDGDCYRFVSSPTTCIKRASKMQQIMHPTARNKRSFYLNFIAPTATIT